MKKTQPPEERRQALRIIPGGKASQIVKSGNAAATLDDPKRPGLKNPLVQIMNSYADQIDRDIQAILDL